MKAILSDKSLTLRNGCNFINVCFWLFSLVPNRLKRDSTKLNTADMLALLSYLESNQHNRYDNDNDNISPLEYQKSLYAPYGNFDGANNDDDDAVSGEWLNEWIEPSVQYLPRGRFDDNARKRLTSTGIEHY